MKRLLSQLLVAASTFTLFPWVNDCQIMGRWLTGATVALSIILGCKVYLLKESANAGQAESLPQWFRAFGYALLTIMVIHFIISAGELSGIIPDSSAYKGTVSFDNPAGFAAMIVAG